MAAETHSLEGMALRDADLYKSHAAGKYWRWSTWGALGLLGVSILGNVYLGQLPKWKTHYVQIDRCHGDVRVIGAIPDLVTLPQLAVNKTVRAFVDGLRSISVDEELTKQHWRALEHQLTPKGRQRFLSYQHQYDPLRRKDPVTLDNLQVFPRTATTYYVRWTEQVFSGTSARRELLSTTNYAGLFTLERREPRTQEERDHAPLGLFFDDWHWQKE
jgi:type IV secretory pathway TrbF-like protein